MHTAVCSTQQPRLSKRAQSSPSFTKKFAAPPGPPHTVAARRSSALSNCWGFCSSDSLPYVSWSFLHAPLPSGLPVRPSNSRTIPTAGDPVALAGRNHRFLFDSLSILMSASSAGTRRSYRPLSPAIPTTAIRHASHAPGVVSSPAQTGTLPVLASILAANTTLNLTSWYNLVPFSGHGCINLSVSY